MTRRSATIIGPIEGGRGFPTVQPPSETELYNYCEAEFFAEGTARSFRFAGEDAMPSDGNWRVEPAGSAAYRTRLVVHRPLDPSRFNGTVIVLWNNVSAGFDNIRTHPFVYEGGFALVAVSLQRVGLEGFTGPDRTGLKATDPERYASLSIPSDDLSYDMLTQIGRAVGKARQGPIDPLGGLNVRHVLARGASQSGNRLATYINAVAPLGHPFDGFMIDVYMGTPASLTEPAGDGPRSLDDLATLVDGTCQPGNSRLRDLPVPVFVVNTESECRSFAAVRKPDSAHYRYWEAAGLAHAGGIKVSAAFTAADLPPNEIDIKPLRDAALWQMQRWVADGIPPAMHPPIELEGTDHTVPPLVVRDTMGIAKGGLRLPQLSVPLAIHTGFNGPRWAFLRGSSIPLPHEVLTQLYGTCEEYLRQFRAAAEQAVAAGVLLPGAVAPMIAEARALYCRMDLASNRMTGEI